MTRLEQLELRVRVLQRQVRKAGFDINQLRDMAGRWSQGGGAGLSERLLSEGGFTYHVVSGTSPTSGYALSPYKDRERVLDVKTLTPTDLVNYVLDNQDLLDQPDHYFGAWHSDGKVYLDVAIVADSRSKAERLARLHRQLAYFDLKSKETINVRHAA